MLDKKSEEVLKFLISKYDKFNAKGYPIYLTAKDFRISELALDQLCLFLEENGLITHGPHSKSKKIYLTSCIYASFYAKKILFLSALDNFKIFDIFSISNLEKSPLRDIFR